MRRTHTLLAAVAVLIGGLGFTAGSFTAADAGRKPVSKSQVKKIAKKEIAKAAPTLSVAHAATAATAATAGDADTLGHQTRRAKVVKLDPASPASTLVSLGGLSLVATCTTIDAKVTAHFPGGGQLSFVHGDGTSGGSIVNDTVLANGIGGTGGFVFAPSGGGPLVAGSYTSEWTIDSRCAYYVDVLSG